MHPACCYKFILLPIRYVTPEGMRQVLPTGTLLKPARYQAINSRSLPTPNPNNVPIASPRAPQITPGAIIS